MVRSDEMLWQAFRGKPNTVGLLREKAKIVVALVASVLDDGIVIASELRRQMPAIRLGEEETAQAKAETAAFWLHVTGQLAAANLAVAERDIFMDELAAGMARELSDGGTDAGTFLNLLRERHSEYGNYPEWVPQAGQTSGGTLFWEFTKKIAMVLAVGRSAIFNQNFSLLLMRQVCRWDLPKLLKG